MKVICLFLFIAIISFSLMDCHNNKNDISVNAIDTTKQNPIATGSISGIVTLYDEKGIQLNTHDNVKVYLLPENIYKYTNFGGYWKFDSIKNGFHTIVIKKDSFGVYKYLTFSFQSKDTSVSTSLFQYPSFQILHGVTFKINLSPQDTLSNYMIVSKGNYSKGELRSVRFYIVKSSDSLMFNAEGIPYTFTALATSVTDTFYFNLPLQHLYQLGATKGTYGFYFFPSSSPMSYRDSMFNQNVFPFLRPIAASELNVFNFDIP